MKSWFIIVAIIIVAIWLMIVSALLVSPQSEETRIYLEAHKFTTVNILGSNRNNCPDWIWRSTSFNAKDSTGHDVYGVLCKTFTDSVIIRFF